MQQLVGPTAMPAVRGAGGTAFVLPGARPAGHGRRCDAVRPGVPARARRVRRGAELGLILARAGLRHPRRAWRVRWARRAAPGRSARGAALCDALQQAGGIYVKLGQLLSTRPDVVSPGVAAELGRLHEDVAPVPTRRVRRVLAEDLGVEPDAVFTCLDAAPVAAASVAQVHRASLPGGRRVAVKVQRPDVAGRVHCDLDMLTRLAGRVERRTRWAADQRLVATMHALAESLRGELDFAAEAENLRALRRAVACHEDVVVPRPVTRLTRRRVLVMEWIDGVSLAGAAGTLPEADRARLARALLRSFLDQILVEGTFHVDPHPGNVHLTADGRIALLDCGAVSRLDPRQRAALRQMLVAVASRDVGGLGAALLSISAAGVCRDRGRLDAALGRLLDDHLPTVGGVDAAVFGAFLAVLRDCGLALAPVAYGALRALATVQATIGELAPELDLLGEATAYGCELAA